MRSPDLPLAPCSIHHRLPENKLPLLEYRPDPRFPLTLLLCLSLTIWWLVERHSDYGWVLQNILGMPLSPLYILNSLSPLAPGFAFLVHIMKRMMFLPTWVVAIAMMFLFFYDIFMVFITPYITKVKPHPQPIHQSDIIITPKDHQSVMVKAATGGRGGGGGGGGEQEDVELLPIVFIVPKLLPSLLNQICPVSLTGSLPYSLLGYGDVGVPGLLVALCLQFDMRRGTACRFWPYFCLASLGEWQFMSMYG